MKPWYFAFGSSWEEAEFIAATYYPSFEAAADEGTMRFWEEFVAVKAEIDVLLPSS